MPRGGSATPGANPTVLVPAARVSIAGPEHAMPGSTKPVMTRALNSAARLMTDPPLRARRPAAPLKYSTGREPIAVIRTSQRSLAKVPRGSMFRTTLCVAHIPVAAGAAQRDDSVVHFD